MPVVEPSEAELRAANCWESDDHMAGNPSMTAFRRRVRYQQAMWREHNGHPVGGQPHRPRPGSSQRPVGSRIDLEYATRTGANLVTSNALAAARTRTSFIERHQSFDHQRLWADLLSSEALAFNLFGDLSHDFEAATQVASAWFDELPGPVVDVRFAHSPGRLDSAYLNSLRAFDVAMIVDVGGGASGIVAVDVKFHERMVAERPKPSNRDRYLEVARRSARFVSGAADELMHRTVMCETWLEHLLLLSMLQNPTDRCTWARYVVVHPPENVNVVEAVSSYRQCLVDPNDITAVSTDEVINSPALRAATRQALRSRYCG